MGTLKVLTRRYDNSNNTLNILCEIGIKEFLEIIEKRQLLKESKFKEQRDFLQGQKAKIIQQRLETDIKKGTQLPPISIGVIDEKIAKNDVSSITTKELYGYIENKDQFLAIVDGIQRSNILQKVYRDNDILLDTTLLLDLLITKEKFNLLNRMFVLNFGQTPWGEEQQANIIWNILDLKTNVDDKFKAKNLLTFLFAYIYSRYDKVIDDDMDYFYTNLSLLEKPIDKNIDGKLFDSIYNISDKLGRILKKNTILVKTTCFAAFANITDWDSNKNTLLLKNMENIENILSSLNEINTDNNTNQGIEYMTTCLNSFKSGVGLKQRKFFYALLTELFDVVMDSVDNISEKRFIKICESAKSEASKRKDEE